MSEVRKCSDGTTWNSPWLKMMTDALLPFKIV